jgi:hypothetical protein
MIAPPEEAVMRKRCWVFVPALLVAALGCGGGGEGGSGADDVDHQSDLALEETVEVTAHLVPVPGYEYVNVSGLEIGQVADVVDRVEKDVGGDLISGFSLHSIVADDRTQNTARNRRGDYEVGFLQLLGFNEPVPIELEEQIADAFYGAPNDGVITIEEVKLFMFVDEESADSSYTYIWFGGDHEAIFDGADAEPMETWLRAYMSQPGSV